MRRDFLKSCALAGLGYQVIEADSGESGVALAKREMPDVILLDWQ